MSRNQHRGTVLKARVGAGKDEMCPLDPCTSTHAHVPLTIEYTSIHHPPERCAQ